MAAALLAHHLRDAGVEATITSAGVHGDGASPATANAVRVMRGYGLDISAHRSRRLTRAAVESADLVVGMTREHVREAVVLAALAFSRSFTLKELARRTQAARRGTQSLEAWLNGLGSARPRASLLGESMADDVRDPIGDPLRAYRTTAAELDDLVRRVVAAAWPRA